MRTFGTISTTNSDSGKVGALCQRANEPSRKRTATLTVRIELDRILSAPCDSHELIDDALRSFLALANGFKRTSTHLLPGCPWAEAVWHILTGRKDVYLPSEYDIARCCYKLLDADLFQSNQDYVRRQFLYCLLQEDEADTLHLSTALLLFDGRAHESTFEVLQAEAAFPRLVNLIRDRRDDDSGLHRLLLELLYEMSRIQQLGREDLGMSRVNHWLLICRTDDVQ